MAKLPSSKPVWGLDINASAIAGVQMRAVGERIEILAADIVPLTGTPSPADSPGRDRRIWQALQRFQAKHGLASGRVAVCLPGTVFFMRPFNLFRVGDRSEAELVRFEMEQHIPFGLDAVLWDYELFEPQDPASPERNGLLFAMKKEVLNNYFLSLGAAGIEPIYVQAAPLALYHFIQYELQPQQPLLAVEIGRAATSLILINGSHYWTRSVNLGGEMITAGLQESFRPRGLSREEAENIKAHLPGLSRRGDVIERLMPTLRGFVGELRNAVNHLCHEHDVRPAKLVLLGPDSGTYGLLGLLAKELDIMVVTPAGLGRMDVAESADPSHINSRLPSLATAIGAGLQVMGKAASRVNMVGATLLRRRSQTRVRRIAVSAVGAAMAMVIAFGGFSAWQKRVRVNGARTLRQIVDPVNTRRRHFKVAVEPGRAEEQMDAFRRQAEDREMWLITLDKVSRMLPANDRGGIPASQKLWLISLSLKADPRKPGNFQCALEVGALLRPDGRHRHHVKRTLMAPLSADERGIFSNVREVASRRSPTLNFAGGGGPDKYFISRLAFEAMSRKGGER